MIVFDLESDGLLDTITKVHCINAIDRKFGEEYRFTDHEFYQNLDGSTSAVPTKRDGTIADALLLLKRASVIGGQNIIGYDIPAMNIVYPEWRTKATARDTKVMSQVMYPDLKERDFAAVRKGRLPLEFQSKGLIGTHKLESWGIRIGGQLKGDFNPKNYGHTWATMPFTQEMDDYCMQDVRTNVAIFEHFESKGWDEMCFQIEHRVAEIIRVQESIGVPFNVKAAERLAGKLQVVSAELEEQCKKAFAPWYTWDGKDHGLFTPKRDNKTLGYVAGASFSKIKLVLFNPGSRDHIADRFMKLRGWEPTEFTPTGRPEVNETSLAALPYEEAKLVTKYLLIGKRLGQLAEGNKAWLKFVKEDGRIYGRVNTMGCVTGRMSHFSPNMSHVPACYSEYGPECRDLFMAELGRVLVGCDADALELRLLAHFMAKYDGGVYILVILEGRKEDGTDMHSRNRDAIGISSRDVAKTFFYALLYGSGDYNLGTIVMEDWSVEKLDNFNSKFTGTARNKRIARIGKTARAKLMTALPALDQLTKAVQKASKRGWLKGLDGRRIPSRSEHSALNTLCQSAGGVVMKLALVRMFDIFEERGLDVRPLLNVHDEVQLSALPKDAEEVGKIAVEAIEWAGKQFDLRCPLTGEYAIGKTWKETH